MDTFLSQILGITTTVRPVTTSRGALDAHRIVATKADGTLDESLLPAGIGAPTIVAPASEGISAGRYVNVYSDTGVVKVRLADNSNGRPAHGFVKAAVLDKENATVYGLGIVNSGHTGLTPGKKQYLGTAGGTIETPLDGSDPLNAGFVCQELGVATSATEVLTASNSFVLL